MIAINEKQRGEVSLFVVIFAALLLTIVTVSFVRIMVNNQQQASTIDLSQSAYDSAQAGVEDAKRAILYYQSVCGDPTKTIECNTAKTAINNSTNCNIAVGLLNDIKSSSANTPSEIKVQNGNSSNSLDQAYTCTTITFNTSDYVSTLAKNSYDTIPLQGITNSFDTVKVDWFMSTNYTSNLGNVSLVNGVPLLETWPLTTPPILRAQLVQFDSNGGFKLSELDDVNGSGESNTNTLFLYPSSVGLNSASFATTDVRRSVNPGLPGSPFQVKCVAANATSGGYACSVNIKLPKPVHNTGNRTAFLRLGALYNQATYKVQLIDSSTTPNKVVEFNGVEPIIDSTGRANDLFRRVQARVKLSSDFTYPNAEIYTNGDFCKNFLVTDKATDYPANNIGNTCAP